MIKGTYNTKAMLWILVLAIFTTGCSAFLKYKERLQDDSKYREFGYAQKPLGNDLFEISYEGRNDPETIFPFGYALTKAGVEALARLRAAEVTIENGFKFFVIERQSTGEEKRPWYDLVLKQCGDRPSSQQMQQDSGASTRYLTCMNDPGTARVDHYYLWYKTTLLIKVYKEKPDDTRAIDAADSKRMIRQSFNASSDGTF